MFVLDRIKMLKVIGEQFDFLRNFNLEFIRDLWETFVRSVNNWFAISQSNFSTNVPLPLCYASKKGGIGYEFWRTK
jgi:hypothetical protein